MRDGMTVALAGIALGAGAAWLLGRTLVSLQYGVSMADPASWAVVLTVLLATALAAAWRPARAAAGANPVTLLREE
jgi:ABC-type antimicrobial peptide transport system permease subunit